MLYLQGSRTFHQLVNLGSFKADQMWNLSTSILFVYLKHRGNEKVLLLARIGLPVVGFNDGDRKSLFVRSNVVLDLRQVIQIPGFADLE
jgi:hypothetical protein